MQVISSCDFVFVRRSQNRCPNILSKWQQDSVYSTFAARDRPNRRIGVGPEQHIWSQQLKAKMMPENPLHCDFCPRFLIWFDLEQAERSGRASRPPAFIVVPPSRK
jgi:hypothetical protein